MPSLTNGHKAGANQPKKREEVVHAAIEHRQQHQPNKIQCGTGVWGSVGVKYRVMVVHGCTIPFSRKHQLQMKNENPASDKRSMWFCLPSSKAEPNLMSKDAVGIPFARIALETHPAPLKTSIKP